MALHHPFIVGLHYAFQTSRYLCLVLDLVRGGNLDDLHKKMKEKGNTISEEQVGIDTRNQIIYVDSSAEIS